jgi:hypothetical protein
MILSSKCCQSICLLLGCCEVFEVMVFCARPSHVATTHHFLPLTVIRRPLQSFVEHVFNSFFFFHQYRFLSKEQINRHDDDDDLHVSFYRKRDACVASIVIFVWLPLL